MSIKSKKNCISLFVCRQIPNEYKNDIDSIKITKKICKTSASRIKMTKDQNYQIMSFHLLEWENFDKLHNFDRHVECDGGRASGCHNDNWIHLFKRGKKKKERTTDPFQFAVSFMKT